MKFSRSMTLWGMLLSLSGVFGVMPMVLAQDEELTTARDVWEAAPEDKKETLKKFVESARDHFLNLPISALLSLGDLLREEGGDWNYKSMYLVVLTRWATCFITAKIRARTIAGDNRRGGRQWENGRQKIVETLIQNG